MSEHSRRLIFAASVFLVIVSPLYERTLMPATHLFDGTSLAGWHTVGHAAWRVDAGTIAASAKSDSGGWLILDKGYEDFILKFAFQCTPCEGGVLLRDAPVEGSNTSGLYVPLSGPDAASIYRVTLDAQGRELDRKPISARKPRNSLARITSLQDGWKEFSILLHGALAVDGQSPAANDTGGRYGQIALGITNGDLRVKDISVDNLLERHLGLPDEVTGKGFRRVQLTDRYYSEGITAGDFNHDGKMDIVAGPYYYPGPDFKTGVEIYPPRTYSIGSAN